VLFLKKHFEKAEHAPHSIIRFFRFGKNKMETVWTIDVTRLVGEDNLNYVEDSIRLIMIQVVIQVMLVVTDPDRFSFYDGEFLSLLLFLFAGISAYYLIFKKLVRLT
jgi:hypothetical protein